MFISACRLPSHADILLSLANAYAPRCHVTITNDANTSPSFSTTLSLHAHVPAVNVPQQGQRNAGGCGARRWGQRVAWGGNIRRWFNVAVCRCGLNELRPPACVPAQVGNEQSRWPTSLASRRLSRGGYTRRRRSEMQ